MTEMIKPQVPKAPEKVKVTTQTSLIQNVIRGGNLNDRLQCEGLSLNAPTEHLRWQLPILRARSRNIISNHSMASSAVEKWVSNLIGTGIRPSWNTGDSALDQQLSELWESSVHEFDADGRLDIYGMQALVAREIFEAGEVLTRFRPRRTEDGLNVPLQIQLIEADYLPECLSVSPKGTKADVRVGIQFDAIGRRSGYWVHKSHPLETFTNDLNDYAFVDAKNMIHTYNIDRAGQLRGIPQLSSVLLKLYDLDAYDEAELIRKKTASLFAGFVTKHESLVDDGCVRDADFQDMQAGSIHYLDEGEEISFTSPPSDGFYPQYIRTQLQAIAAGAGVTYEQMTGDLSNVNYSSLRAGLLEFRRRIEMVQKTLIVHQWMRPIVTRWLEVAALTGSIPFDDFTANRKKYMKIKFIAPRFEQIDPTKETQSDIADVRAGFASRSEKVARRGRTVEELDREIRSERKLTDEDDLILDSDPNHTGGNGQIQNVNNDQDDQEITENDPSTEE